MSGERKKIRGRDDRWSSIAGQSQLASQRACYASSLGGATGALARHHRTPVMPYRVVSFTMAQVRQGALGFQRELSAILRERPEIKVYSVSPFDLAERRRFRDRFGGDIVYFVND